jgi:putative flippase GtrA
MHRSAAAADRASPGRSSFRAFLLVGAVGFVVDGAVLTTLCGVLGWSPLQGRMVSFPVALTVTWIMNRRLAFAGRRMRSTTGEYIAYALVQSLGAALNYGVFCLFVVMFAVKPLFLMLPLAAGSILAAVFNFLMLRRYVYGGDALQ